MYDDSELLKLNIIKYYKFTYFTETNNMLIMCDNSSTNKVRNTIVYKRGNTVSSFPICLTTAHTEVSFQNIKNTSLKTQ